MTAHTYAGADGIDRRKRNGKVIMGTRVDESDELNSSEIRMTETCMIDYQTKARSSRTRIVSVTSSGPKMPS